MRQTTRLLAALALVVGAQAPSPAAPPVPPSVFDERAAAGPVTAEVCQEATRNTLYGTRKVGLDYYFVGR